MSLVLCSCHLPFDVNGWVNTGDVGDLRRHRAHYDVIELQMAAQNENEENKQGVRHCKLLNVFMHGKLLTCNQAPAFYQVRWLAKATLR